MENIDRLKFHNHHKIIGIDPGVNGGISVYSCDDKRVIEVSKMPATAQEKLDFLRQYSNNAVCYLERVQGMPGNSGSSMFNFGCGFGHIEMALLALQIPFTEITPQKWQKTLQLGHKGTKTATQWKNKLKDRACQYFPYVGKITLAVADSLLILEYGRIVESSKL